ncbi:hypothetical protein HV824_10755 [Myxococcus sp. AM009]|uniref:phospholipase D-like domain-containing protein n=1 Tax=unclassified Myxococcus TaxID=2648731 RepID=UPI0015955227|nr:MULTISPECIES: phospholipase D-like domain-containing protein [unclassified Myxococcus]NVI98597.1 hypothetical protein [Myxococcus sp. AM009]NVJ15220.1 hypothetical protein [Myxococcus sp. AM010]
MAIAGAGRSRIEILNHTQTVANLMRLITEAERELLLVSPYVSLDKLRAPVRAIQGALHRKVRVELIIREKDFSTRQADPFAAKEMQELRAAGMQVHLLKDLHAKVYLSEKNALITSLNLLESSINNSIEVSTWLCAGTPEYQQLVEVLRTDIRPTSVKVETAVHSARATRAETAPGRTKTKASRAPSFDDLPIFVDDEGHCIRCGDDVAFNTDKPLCTDCFGTWRRFGDPSYREAYCHACGEDEDTSVAKPLCYDCFRNM